MEVSDVRRRLRAAIEDARRRAAERRGRNDEAARTWERALADVVIPTFHQVAQALNAEGYRFKVVTPGATARLVPERGGDEFVELALVTDRDEPAVLLASTQGRGRRTVSAERVVREGAAIASLSEDDVVAAVLEALLPFIER